MNLNEFKNCDNAANVYIRQGNYRAALNEYIPACREFKKNFSSYKECQSTYYDYLEKIISLEVSNFDFDNRSTFDLILIVMNLFEEFIFPFGREQKTQAAENARYNVFKKFNGFFKKSDSVSYSPCMSGKGCALNTTSTGIPFFDEEDAKSDPRHLSQIMEFGSSCPFRILRRVGGDDFFVCPKTFEQPPSFEELCASFRGS
jgi:hypothetical protein